MFKIAHHINEFIKVSFCRTCFSKVRYRRPVFRPSIRPSFRPQLTSTLAFKSIQMTYSLKPLHPWISNFICSFSLIKFKRAENSRWPPLLKIAKLLKSPFSPKQLGIFSWNFVWTISRTLILIDVKMKKKSVAELDHSDRLKIHVNPSKIYINPGI